MGSRWWMKALLSGLAAAVVAACTPARPAARLALRLEPGDRVRVVQTAHQEIESRQVSTTRQVTQDTRVQVVLEVRGRDPGGSHSIDATWEGIELSLASPAGALRWDSRTGGGAGRQLDPLSGLAGKCFALVVSGSGVVTAGGGAELAASEAAALFCRFPQQAVRPGDSWDSEVRQASTGLVEAVRARSRWTLASRSGGTSVIRVITAVEGIEDRAGIAPLVQGGGRGRYEVEEATGRILSAVVEHDVTVSIPGARGPTTVRVKRLLRTESTLLGAPGESPPAR